MTTLKERNRKGKKEKKKRKKKWKREIALFQPLSEVIDILEIIFNCIVERTELTEMYLSGHVPSG